MQVLDISEATRAHLGWNDIAAAWRERTRTPFGKQQLATLAFVGERRAIAEALELNAEARSLLARDLPIPLGGVHEVAALLRRADKGAILEGAELLQCGAIAQAAAQVAKFVGGLADDVPGLAQIAGRLPELDELWRELDGALENGGEVRDDASQALWQQRRAARGLRDQIKHRLDGMLKDDDVLHMLQDDYYSVRNDRYVLPLKADFRGQMPGIVHNASQTEQTLFVEPNALVSLGNDLAIARSLAVEEERKVLRELTASVAGCGADIGKACDLLGRLDLLQAGAQLSEDLDCHPPDLVAPGDGIELKAVRHPLLLLQGKPVVANDIALVDGARGLIISGPNAGGKTVGLTAVGLATLMVHSGLPIPADPKSRVPIMGGVACIVGDAQDLSRDLSTFSAHLQQLAEMLALAGEGWLVLIDEIASGTDPKEGAAIAAACLEALVDAGATIGVTTHLEDLKAFALTDKRFVNACVGLDPKTRRPTFALALGVAGVSNAIDVAEDVGLPTAVVAKARQHLQTGGRLTAALAQLQQQEASLRGRLRQAEAHAQAAADELERLKGQRQELHQERLQVRQEVLAEVAAEFDDARKTAAKRVAELQQEGAMQAAQALQQQASAARDRAKAMAQPSKPPPPEAEFVVGDWVTTALGQKGEVMAIDGNEALLAVGSLRMRAKLRDLKPATGKRQPSRGRASKAPSDKELSGLVCDVRGQRVAEAIAQMETFLDEHFLRGTTQVSVLHGKGTGALKRATREALRESRYVKSFHNAKTEHGGDGVTEVVLQDR